MHLNAESYLILTSSTARSPRMRARSISYRRMMCMPYVTYDPE